MRDKILLAVLLLLATSTLSIVVDSENQNPVYPIQEISMTVKDEIKNSRFYLVVFGAGWCKSTKRFLLGSGKKTRELIEKIPHTKVGWVDIYRNFEIRNEVDIRHFPTFVLYSDWGKYQNKTFGSTMKPSFLAEWVKKLEDYYGSESVESHTFSQRRNGLFLG